ncbi:hypothetical protein ABFG93_21590 (plasmid) [Pseudalkalibacillus hwajinpoensis]|uniref:hypothetical protein n=1 Tax=Guptibacillus hwajinpoensis TaxID=208199 RepID=UPI00325B7C1F
MSPFFAFLFSMVMKEKVSKQTVLYLPLFIIGAIILIDLFQFDSYTVYAWAGVVSAMLAGGAATSIRYLSRSHHTYEIVFCFLATGTIVALPLMWMNMSSLLLMGGFICLE